METTIRKVLVPRFGDESVLQLVEANIASPQAGEVQVQVLHSVVAGSDVNMRRGTYPFQKKAPLTPGYSMVGKVLENGSGCTKFALGTLVACLTKYDAQAERMNVPEKFVVPVPEGVDLRQATALSHLAQLRGAEVFGTASASKHEELSAGGSVVFDYKQKEWIREMQRRGGVDSVFDPLGYQSFDESCSVLRKGGLLVGYGQNLPALTNTSRPSPYPMIIKLLARNLGFWSGKRTTFFGLSRGSKHFAPDLELLFRWLAEDRVRVPIKAVFALADVQEAHRMYARGSGVGSIVLDVSSY